MDLSQKTTEYEKLITLLIPSDISRKGTIIGNAQGDHVTAFEFLAHRLRNIALEVAQKDGGFHTTQVRSHLLQMVRKEEHVLRASKLINETSLLEQFQSLFPDFRPKQPENCLDEIESYGLAYFKQNTTDSKLEPFLRLYGKIIMFNEMKSLETLLKEEENSLRITAQTIAKDVTHHAISAFEQTAMQSESIKALDLADKNKLKSTIATSALKETQPGQAITATQKMISVYSEHLNKLPFVVFKRVTGVSGKGRYGGGSVGAAMKKFKDACKTQDVNAAAISLSLLLDFHPLLSSQNDALQKDLHEQTTNGKIGAVKNAHLDTRAAHFALTRDNDETILAYVIARHWQLACSTFIELKDIEDTDKGKQIRDAFIKHMLTRWEYASKKTAQAEENGYELEKSEAEVKDALSQQASTGNDLWEKTTLDKVTCIAMINNMCDEYKKFNRINSVDQQSVTNSPLASSFNEIAALIYGSQSSSKRIDPNPTLFDGASSTSAPSSSSSSSTSSLLSDFPNSQSGGKRDFTQKDDDPEIKWLDPSKKPKREGVITNDDISLMHKVLDFTLKYIHKFTSSMSNVLSNSPPTTPSNQPSDSNVEDEGTMQMKDRLNALKQNLDSLASQGLSASQDGEPPHSTSTYDERLRDAPHIEGRATSTATMHVQTSATIPLDPSNTKPGFGKH